MGRIRRWWVLGLFAVSGGAVLLAALVVPATAGAQISSLSVTVGALQAQGTEVPIQVDFQCNDPSLDLSFVGARLTQVSGHKLAQGSDSFGFNDPPCDSSFSVPFTVTAQGAFAFKRGNVTVSVDVLLFDPTADNFQIETFTQTTRLRTK
jgi:hypothetical protein